ncbi:hypothetical protein [Halalkalicoccus jeotgali]|uniref:Uncharacterized protein n=1 Tax=Halalkalicoccus jeotgali (strain DSM 18796 / CECT 7217 / JCM 14584 / KCTC 4019 / B3) TaxID=795797 RepID=D8J6X0_HALJB|nr:hypothetical protein [Halalkalicoccus jeotgali]ADJ15923.1 hypothetical protein HacjB3_12710 [Halalkalicoccus jeotgali B3]ELY38019.1 hypothetical protein C497_07914 [Halalkalicoccus jeotgali B3]
MFERLACTCEGCDRPLTVDDPELEFRRGECRRRAYECGCGTVTITVARR